MPSSYHAGFKQGILHTICATKPFQGPKSRDVLCAAFGDAPTELKYYRFMEYDWNGVPLIISRTGWSSELGYEIFLRDGSHGDRLWEHLMAVGTPLGLKSGYTSSIRRIEAGMLSYHADMTLANNPFEIGMGRLVDLDMDADFVSKAALKKNQSCGSIPKICRPRDRRRAVRGLQRFFWPVLSDGNQVGKVTSAIYSPRLEKNIALALVGIDYAGLGTALTLKKFNEMRGCKVVEIPFFDPKKSLASAS